jgi:hypothetical protein
MDEKTREHKENGTKTRRGRAVIGKSAIEIDDRISSISKSDTRGKT